MADQELPMDLVTEVLIRLPVKSILRFRCVSKTWHDLIRSHAFITAHQKREGKQKILLVKDYSRRKNGKGELFSFSDLWIRLGGSYSHLRVMRESLQPQNGEGEALSFHDQDMNVLKIRWEQQSNIPFHGPCNGLVCVVYHKYVFLCNPALREFKLLPPPAFPVGSTVFPFLHGFAFDPVAGAYKVIQLSEMSHDQAQNQAKFRGGRLGGNRLRIDLYNSASNSWKQIHCDDQLPTVTYLPGYELLYNGVIHWAIMNPHHSPSILCFDVSTETFRQLHLHENFGQFEQQLRLMELDQSLAVVRYPRWIAGRANIEIWVMKEYAVKESWTKQFVIAPYCYEICPLSFLKNEPLPVESGDELHGDHFKGFQFCGTKSWMTAVFYEESLISLDQIIATESACK